MSDFNFPVELRDCFTAEGLKVNRRAVLRTDTNTVISDVGATYKLVHHSELFALAEEYMQKIGPCTVKHHIFNNGKRLFAEYTFKDIDVAVKKGDTVGLRTYFAGSYDGKSSIRLGVSGIRIACMNGMVVAGANKESLYRHTGDNIQDGKLVNIDFPTPDNILGAFEKGSKHWQKLSQIELSPEQLAAYETQAIEENVISPMIDKIDDIEENTAWGLYNKFTELITHKERKSATFHGKLQRYNKVANWFEGVFA